MSSRAGARGKNPRQGTRDVVPSKESKERNLQAQKMMQCWESPDANVKLEMKGKVFASNSKPKIQEMRVDLEGV